MSYEPIDDGIKLGLHLLSTGALIYIANRSEEIVNYLRKNYQETKALRKQLNKQPDQLEEKILEKTLE